MRYIELPEKIEIIMNIVLDSKILVIMLMALLLLTFLFINKNISKKKYLLSMIMTFIIAFVITILTNSKALLATFDEVINKLFFNVYFPSVAVYAFILIVMFVVVVNTMINKKQKKAYKINNILMFFTNTFLFISFLLTISDKSIDVFDQSSIYTNQACVVLLQLTTSVFIIWLVISLIIYIINAIIDKVDAKEEMVPITFDTNITDIESNINVEPVKLENELQDFIIETDEEIINEPVSIVTEIVESKEKEDLVIENPIIAERPKFSLKDYKIFNRMLKNTIMLNSYKKNITLDDMLNPNTLGVYTDEEYKIYKEILQSYID